MIQNYILIKKVIYDMDVYELISIAGCDKAMPNVAYHQRKIYPLLRDDYIPYSN